MRALIVAATVYAVSSFAVSRLAAFSEAYHTASAEERKQDWLRTQCMNATFFANIGQHSDICEAVQRRKAPVLVALEAMVQAGVAPWGWPLFACVLPVSVWTLQWMFRALRRNRRRMLRQRDLFL